MILHVDGDNFFVACEVARFPHLKGKAVIVGEERGIAAALSYEAKRIGITRGMPIFEIRKKFPEVVILPSHFELYEQYNLKLYNVLQKYSSNVERYSIDECFAFIEDSAIQQYQEKHGQSLISEIKRVAEESLGITLSFGLAHTKTLAKIGSKKNKPSGCVTILEQDREQILRETPVGSVWGIGRAISAKLTSYNVITAYDFTRLDNQFVKKNFGEGTLSTWYELKGHRRLEINDGRAEEDPHDPQKSFQSTRSFGMSTRERSFLLSELSTNTEILCARLRQANLKTNRISFFLKNNSTHDRYATQEIIFDFYTNSEIEIFGKIKSMFDRTYASSAKLNVLYKATGVSVYGLKAPESLSDDLFNTQKTHDSNNDYINTLDDLKSRFGDKSIHLCSSLQSRNRREVNFNERNIRNKFIYGLPLPYMGEVS